MPRRQSLFIFSWFALILFLSFPRTLAQQSKPDFSELEKVALAELAESNTPGAAIAMTYAEMARYAGVYGNQANRVEIVSKDGKLWFKGVGRETEITKTGDMHFSTTGQPSAEFALVAGANGKAEFLHLSGRTLSRIEPRP